ncbi:MAG TPA: hypothetical protein DHW64_12200 [Chitinophagaceae bacterium]|nr:hypothetical protein [Chitinophagaceae bacterium]
MQIIKLSYRFIMQQLNRRVMLKPVLLIQACLLCSSVVAQNNTSPYSILGIGDIEKSSFDRTTGMGHAGLALPSYRYLNHSNPASYSYLEDRFFHFELSTRFRSVGYSGEAITDGTNATSSDMQFKKAALAIKLKSGWGASFGVLPVSSSNYSFYGNKNIQGSNLFANTYYEGTGSLNKVYLANAFKVGKKMSLGVELSYLFGQKNEEEEVLSNVSASLLTKRNVFMSGPSFKLGWQWQTQVHKNFLLSAGATFSGKTSLNAVYSLEVREEETPIVKREEDQPGYFTIPVSYAGGLALTYKKAYTLAFDYTSQPWSNLQYKGFGYSLNNSNRYSFGLEYAPKKVFRNIEYDAYQLQAGAFRHKTYLNYKGHQLTEYGITLGAGTMLTRSGLGLNGSIELGMRGNVNNGMIKEKYTSFNLTISYRDFWYTLGRRYD